MTKTDRLLAGAVWAAVPASVLAQPMYYGRDWPGGPMMFGGAWTTAFWWVMPLVMMTLVVIVCVAIVRSLLAAHDGHHRSGLRILGERLAKGEISKDEYEEKRKLLEKS